MDPELVKSMNSVTNMDPTSGNSCWETPPEVFAALDSEFHFDVDLTGGPGTQHRCPTWFGPGGLEENALGTSWSMVGMKGFSNPPYGKFIPLIMEKAYQEAIYGFTTVFLLPNRVTRWYKNAMRHAHQIRIVDERIAFWEDGHPRRNKKILAKTGKQVPDPAMFDSCIVVVKNTPKGAGLYPRAAFDIWHWDPERLKKCRLTA